MSILLISGSPRQHSNSSQVTDLAERILNEKDIKTVRLNLHQHQLPLMDGEAETEAHPLVVQLQTKAHEASGFFMCTPEYHSGMSGALKNALDFLSREQFYEKPVAIAAASGGGKGGINALNNLRTVLRGVSAWVTSNQVVVDPKDILNENQFSPQIEKKMNQLIDEFILLTKVK